MEEYSNRQIKQKEFRKLQLWPQPSPNWDHGQCHEHEQKSWHLGNTCSRPKQFYNLHQVYPRLLLQHMLFPHQLYGGPDHPVWSTSNIHLQVSILTWLTIFYLPTSSVSKIHRKIQGTPNRHSITETKETPI